LQAQSAATLRRGHRRLEAALAKFRPRRRPTVNGTLTKGFLYCDPLRIATELDAVGNIVSRFVDAGSNVPVAMIKGGTTFAIISDHVGSVRLVVDSATGSVARRIDYDSFGNVLVDSNPGFQPFGFAGGLYDPDTNLVRFGMHDYDAATGRWTAKDPMGSPVRTAISIVMR
jgi:RHS repeat-associated protein